LTVEGTEQNYAARRRVGALLVALALMAALATSGCGAGKRQDADAKSGTWKVVIEQWKFPKTQYLGTPTSFTLKVRNVDTAAIPQLILTIDGLKTRVKQTGAASQIRPIWLISEDNYAQFTSYNSALATSYNLGQLDAGDVKTYTVKLTPLRRGSHKVSYELAGDLYGKAKVVDNATDEPAADSRTIAIDPTPQFDDSFFKD
jgi:hypothetical protein